MKVSARWLTKRLHQLNTLGRSLYNALMILFILPASILFCLTLMGCEDQEDRLVSLGDSPENNSQITTTGESKRSTIRIEKAKIANFPRIVAFGDSLTAGLGVTREEAYPGQLARWLREQGFAYDVINAGVSGDTSAGGLRRVEWILKSKPRMVILELGANDGLRGQPLKETYNNLNAIIDVLKAKGVIVVLAGMRLPLNYGDEYTREFSNLYARLAQEQDVPLIPFFLKDVATHRHLNQGDGLHPNAEGYSIVVRNVWQTIQPLLKELAQEG